jgi:hypothetical protein
MNDTEWFGRFGAPPAHTVKTGGWEVASRRPTIREIVMVLYSHQEIQAIARDPALRWQAIEQCKAVEKYFDNLRTLTCDG